MKPNQKPDHNPNPNPNSLEKLRPMQLSPEQMLCHQKCAILMKVHRCYLETILMTEGEKHACEHLTSKTCFEAELKVTYQPLPCYFPLMSYVGVIDWNPERSHTWALFHKSCYDSKPVLGWQLS